VFLFYASMSLAVVSIIFYHLFQKLTPESVNPMASLAVTFATATITCVVLLLLFPSGTSSRESLRHLNWVSFALAFAIVGADVGFLLAYRAGWSISLGALMSNVTVTLMLAPIGLLFFKEDISVTKAIGIAVCLGGLFLINQA